MLISISFALLSFTISFGSTNDLDSELNRWKDCFVTNFKLTIGGEIVDIKEVPFTLLLEGRYMINTSEKNWYCGASILTTKIAITAKHCVVKTYTPVSNLIVKSGYSSQYEEIHPIKKVVLYSYVPTNDLYDDIALLFVQKPFKFSPAVRPLKLPPSEPSDGLETMVAGWGGNSNSKLNINPKLTRAIIPIVNRKICHRLYKEHFTTRPYEPNGKNFYVSYNDRICGGTPSMNVANCHGDSGGPVFYNDTLYGIVSGGMSCAQPCIPNFFTNVYRYVDWIKREIRKG